MTEPSPARDLGWAGVRRSGRRRLDSDPGDPVHPSDGGGDSRRLRRQQPLRRAFLISTALWWLYFSDAGGILVDRLSSSTTDETGALGRDVYTFVHLPIIAGIVLTAVGDELVIAHPGEALALSGAVVTLVGPALYLVALVGCLVRVGSGTSWPIVIIAAVLVAAVPLATRVSGLATLDFVMIALVALAVWERRTAWRGRS